MAALTDGSNVKQSARRRGRRQQLFVFAVDLRPSNDVDNNGHFLRPRDFGLLLTLLTTKFGLNGW